MVERTINKTAFIEPFYHIMAGNDKKHTHLGNNSIWYIIIDRVTSYKEEIKSILTQKVSGEEGTVFMEYLSNITFH